MSDIDQIIRAATVSMCSGSFDQAEQLLTRALASCSSDDDAELLLQQLMFLFSHPLNRNLDRAQTYMDARESRRPAGYVALSQAYFQLYTGDDPDRARHWARVATERAEVEADRLTLCSANALLGLVAAKAADGSTVESVLNALELLISEGGDILYGDAVVFFEAACHSEAISAATRLRVKRLAALITPLIGDDEFRARAEAIAQNPSLLKRD